MHKRLMPTAVVCCVLLSIPLVGCKARSKRQTPAAPPVITLGVEDYTRVERLPVQSGPSISGTLAPKRQAVLRGQLAGAVLETHAEQGQAVAEGQLLAKLDEGSLRNSIASAKLAVTNARNALSVAERDLGRDQELAKVGAVSKREIDASRQATVAARAGLGQARAALAEENKRLDYAAVKAPFNGIISELHASVGDVVQLGTPIYTLIDPSSLELAAAIPAQQLGAIHVGAPVEFQVTGYPDREFRGTVTRINPTADPLTRQIRVYAELANEDHSLVSGLYAEGVVESESRVALSVPEHAIDRRTAKPAVVRVRNGKVERVEVALGLTDERAERVEIRNGIQAGDVVLLGATQELEEGTRVRLTGRDRAAEVARTVE